MYAETEDKRENTCVISRLYPEPVCISTQCHADGTKELLCLLEGLVVLQQHRKRVDGERLAAPPKAVHLE